jgi:hypothetical protein
MQTKIEINKEQKLKIIDGALTHIKKIEADPNHKFEDVDAYDAWYSYNNYIDVNVHEANFGMGKDQINKWFCTIYPVEFDKETETFRTNSDAPTRLFQYKNGKVVFDD